MASSEVIGAVQHRWWSIIAVWTMGMSVPERQRDARWHWTAVGSSLWWHTVMAAEDSVRPKEMAMQVASC